MIYVKENDRYIDDILMFKQKVFIFFKFVGYFDIFKEVVF